ncbi:TraX family protein [Sorangium sp. So ce204]|uniref:TraX family protein n=1 Tax=Sorangium sp. So ce204 TaxID=3133288 RepID=UPI003F6031EE
MKTARPPSSLCLPRLDGRALDFVKICAALCMVVDHVNTLLLDYGSTVMFLIGRASFPLFCYASAVAVIRAGGDGLRQAGSLLLLAAFTEPISQVARHQNDMVNVVFTLAAGCAVATFLPRLAPVWRNVIVALVPLTVWMPTTLEFGLAGVCLPAVLVLALKGERGAWPLLFVLLASINLYPLEARIREDGAGGAVQATVLYFLAATFLPWVLLQAGRRLKNDHRLLHRHALQIFYPGHMLVLWILELLGASV